MSKMTDRLYGGVEVRWGQKVRRFETRAKADAFISRLKARRPAVEPVIVEGAQPAL